MIRQGSSYAFYILQFGIGFTGAVIGDRHHFYDFTQTRMISPMVRGPVYYLIVLCGLILVSILAFRYVETPIRRAIRRKFAIPAHAIANTVGVPMEREAVASE